jgi:hypothetical protein
MSEVDCAAAGISGAGPSTATTAGAGGSILPSEGNGISPVAWLREAAWAARLTSVR